MFTAANRASPARHAFGSRNFRLSGDGTSTAVDLEIQYACFSWGLFIAENCDQ
jgi:hypothetical protein